MRLFLVWDVCGILPVRGMDIEGAFFLHNVSIHWSLKISFFKNNKNKTQKRLEDCDQVTSLELQVQQSLWGQCPEDRRSLPGWEDLEGTIPLMQQEVALVQLKVPPNWIHPITLHVPKPPLLGWWVKILRTSAHVLLKKSTIPGSCLISNIARPFRHFMQL